MVEKLIITVAPTGNVPTGAMTPLVPVTPEQIARDIVDCTGAGAAVAHIHVRDEEERPAFGRRYFEKILELLDRADCPVIR